MGDLIFNKHIPFNLGYDANSYGYNRFEELNDEKYENSVYSNENLIVLFIDDSSNEKVRNQLI